MKGSFHLVQLLLLSLLCFVQSFVNSPKIISKDGNLIFESGSNRNISFQLKGSSRLIINEKYDVLDLLMPISGTNKRPGGAVRDEWSGGENIMDLRELTDQLTEFKSQALGANGLNAMLRRLQNRTMTGRGQLQRLQTRLRMMETTVQRLKVKLELDSCQSNPCENGGSCFVTYNGFQCQCRSAFQGTKCERDVDECALFEGTDLGCQNGGQCVNQFGSFNCLCTPGWHGIYCSQRKTDCAAATAWELCGHGSCVSSSDALGYRCLCEPGWRSNGVTPTCTDDVDECSAAAHTPCSTKCINLPGSFTCAPCDPGLTGNGVSCRDVNECDTNNGGCSLSPRVECINTYGSSHCGECPLGWIGDGHSCVRSSSTSSGDSTIGGIPNAVGLTSCSQRSSVCHPSAICSEISNTIVCSCPRLMVGNGYGENGCVRGTNNNCNDLPCLNGGTCLDTDLNNFTCLCPRGFRGPRCDPLPNPCTSQPCKNDGRCSPITSSDAAGFVCQCQPGYRGRLCDVRFSSCNGVLTGLSGLLRYPTGGSSYEHNAQCAWVIRTNESLVLNVTFQNFHVEDSTDCRFDWLQLNDGRSAAAQIIGRYCGNHLPHGGNIISSSNQLYLWFRSDNSTAHEGFELTWQSIEPQCGGLINFETHGTLASPGSPGNYPRNRDCQWHLVAPSSKRIKITFFSLQLEQHNSCNFDFVLISDAISGRPLYKFCGRHQPPPALLATHEAIIRFHSDETDTDLGFQLHYSAEERLPGCGGVYTNQEQTIRSPIYASGTDSISCDYEIRLPMGVSIGIDFTQIQLSAGACVELYDMLDTEAGRDANSVLQSKHCGGADKSTLPPSFSSLYNRVRIKYYTSQAEDHFELEYHMVCSKTYDAESGELSSPGYPNLTNSQRVCTFKIITAPNTVITLKRLDFQLINRYPFVDEVYDTEDLTSEQCARGTSLTINDGLNQVILGPYCENHLPAEEYVSKTNMLMLHLNTNAFSGGRGFRFQYRAVPVNSDQCGGMHTKEGQNIRLPVNAEGKYANGLTCYWVIMAPPGKGILLHWLSFDLEGSTDCSYDYVEIYDDLVADGKSQNGHLSRFCDSQVPEDLITHAPLLTIKFVSDNSNMNNGFELSYRFVERDSCGGHIHASTGMINSPRYPLNYSAGLDCIWQLTAPQGTQLELQIEMFELEASQNCSGDWLEVRNGGNNNTALLGRFCGTSIPRRIPSFSHDLYLHFHTDDVGFARGFRIKWRIFANGCGGQLTGSAGVITSPNYPNPYPHNAHCEWQLRVHPGSNLRILIEDLAIEELFDCSFDSLHIDTGRRSNPLFVSDMPPIILCTMPDEKHRVLDMQTNEVLVTFQSDVNNAERGFRLSYSSNCQNTLTATRGIIESLNYAESLFEGTINCSWHILPPRGNEIHLEVSHFDRRLNRLPTDADGGVYLIQGNTVLPIVGLITRNFSGELLTIVHNSSSVNFRLEYLIDGCQHELRGETGSFQSLKYPLMYPNDVECYWLIHTALGQVIELTILDMDIEESVNCTKDVLLISNSNRDTYVHERHCGHNPKLVITSAGHKLHVRFISDNSNNGRGFQATYRVKRSMCGGRLTTKSGVIMSPNYPKPYPRDSECEWQLEVSPHHTIIFDMQDMIIESGYECGWDYVSAYDLTASDGSDVDVESLDDSEGQKIFQLCGSHTEMSMSRNESITNRAVVRFASDDSLQAKGFRLHFHESCGQSLLIDETDFELISLVRQVPVNESCVWVLRAADPSKHIIFTATHVQLYPALSDNYPREGDCIAHGIKIYEGPTVSGTPRQQFCRSHPPALISHGQALTISVPLSLIAEFEGHYMTMDTACGSRYTALAGRFTSPYYPDSYPVNIECEWEVEASAGNSISLTIESIDLELSDGCNNDYLELRELSARGPLIGVYCGSQLPAAISSKGSIWIKFKSNDDAVGEGFMASYNYEHHNELNGNNGTIESPHYPTKFESSDPYTWRITVDIDYIIVLTVDHLRDVDHAYVRFYDGYTDIGPQLVPQPYRPLVSYTNTLFIKATRGPFLLKWERLSKEAVASNRSAELQTRQCGQKLVKLNQTMISFNSPNYPSEYAPNLHCNWIIMSENPASHATLQLMTVDFEYFGVGCYSDYLIVSSSSDMKHWTQLAKICRKLNNTQTYNGQPYLRLELITDSSVQKSGFSSILRTVCGSELTAPRGVINVKELVTNNFMSSLECVWTIRVRQGRRIKISFLESQLSRSDSTSSTIPLGDLNQCRNFIVVRNGYAEDSPFLGRGKYCTSNITDVLETTSNRAYIKFQRSWFPRFRVIFQYEELSHACSGHIVLEEDNRNSSQKIISSPNYPNLPNPHSECVWRISAPPLHRISVDFLNFDLTPSSGTGENTEDGCNQEFLQLNDGSTELMPQLGRFCGPRKPDIVYSSGNEMRIKFYTSVLEPHVGFQAIAKLAECGGSYYSASGAISSPTPDQLQPLLQSRGMKECVYTIEVEKGSTIELKFEPVHLPQPLLGNCTRGTHLQLEEMEPFGQENQERISDRVHICGDSNKNFIVETNKIVIRLRMPTGKLDSDETFQLRYTAVGTRCGETIYAEQGVLQTPNYPSGVRQPSHCVWRVKVPKGRRVKVEILDFDNGAGSNNTRATFRGRLSFSNDHKMQSVIGRYDHDPPAEVISSDNTMAIDAFLLPYSQHRGFKLRFTAYGESECRDQMRFTRSNESSLVYCSYDLRPPPNTTLLLQVLQYNYSSNFMNNIHICRVMSPLKLVRLDESEPLLPLLLCGDRTLPASNRSVRLPFPVEMIVMGNRRNDMTLLELNYTQQSCGGVWPLEPTDTLIISHPSYLDAEMTVDCAWAVGPDQTVEEPLSPEDVQLEVLVSASLEGDCQQNYLLVYSGPDQNSPLMGRYCNQPTGASLVVERGLFLEYHAERAPNSNHSSNFTVVVKYGSGCGGRLTYPYRLIDFNDQYKNNVECIWEIEAGEGFHIGLFFQGRFYIENSNDCTKDYLLVQQRSDVTGNWTELQRLCGRNPPDYINSTTSAMRLIFRSDGDITGDGFFASFERNCGGTFYAVAEPQLMSSPGYPKGYGKNLSCNYTFQPLEEHSSGVLVRFIKFDLERSPLMDCMFDNVTIKTRDNGNKVNESILCGVKQRHAYRAQESINLLLRTDNTFSGSGFQLEYSTSLCGSVINATQMVESPHQHQDNQMPHNSDCYWNLTAAEGQKFTIKFTLLEFESGNVECSYDGVEVYASPVPDEKQRLARFCGQLTNDLPILHISSNRALIHSYSDDRDSSRGFRALVRVLPNCDKRIVLGERNSSYTFNKFVGEYANNLDCSYIIKGPPGSQINIQFRSFHVEATSNCSNDYLEFHDGVGPFADEIGRFCGQDLPPSLMSSRNALFMRFVTDDMTTDTGFELVITATPLRCGNPLIKLDGKQPFELQSPVNDQGNYDNNMFCTWKIETETNLHLQFLSLDLEGPNMQGNCVSDYIKIYSSENAQLLEQGYGSDVIFSGRGNRSPYDQFATEFVYCGSKLPDDFYPDSKQVFVKFRTNGNVTRPGFRIRVVPDSSCRHNYGGVQGRIKYSETIDCDMFIQAPVNYTLSIYFAEITFGSYNCDKESVEIFDTATNKSLHRLCNFLDPGKSIFTQSNDLRIHFNTGSYYNNFDMTYIASPVEKGPGCGGEIYNTAGILSNPFYPQNVRNNSDCRWTIRVPSNTRVLLIFQIFNLGSMTTCRSDYLQILEKDESGDSIEMRRFCGGDRPRVYFSQRSELVLRFHKTVNYDGIGWVVNFSGVFANYEIPKYLLE